MAAKSAVIWLGYYKQGDDLSNHLEKADSPREALENLRTQMLSVANHLRDLIAEIGSNSVAIYADTHHISIEGPEALIDRLIEKELACEDDLCEKDEFPEEEDPEDEDVFPGEEEWPEDSDIDEDC